MGGNESRLICCRMGTNRQESKHVQNIQNWGKNTENLLTSDYRVLRTARRISRAGEPVSSVVGHMIRNPYACEPRGVLLMTLKYCCWTETCVHVSNSNKQREMIGP
jgi:hypothetical protein